MKITIVAGSHRHESQSKRIAEYIHGELTKLAASTFLFSLSDNPLPMWDEGVWAGDEKWKTLWGPISKELQESSGFVFVVPEWGGMVPSGVKNFFLLCGQGELAHKPGLLVSVSSGIGGSYPIAELRMSSYKNTRLCYIPDHLIVRNVEKMLVGPQPSDAHDESLRARASYTLKVLLEYAKALSQVRSSGLLDYKNFPFGM